VSELNLMDNTSLYLMTTVGTYRYYQISDSIRLYRWQRKRIHFKVATL